MNYQDTNKENLITHETSNDFGGIDLDKFSKVLKKSIFWVILIMICTNMGAYLLMRWTKPLYQSISQLKLDVKSEASGLGINNINNLIEEQNVNNILGEIELIKSELFLKKVLDEVNIDVAYFNTGKILNDERYKQSPFRVTYEIKNNTFYNRPFNVKINNSKSFELSYLDGEKAYKKNFNFGEQINTKDFVFEISLVEQGYKNEGFEHFFIIYSNDALIKYLKKSLEVVPINIKANTVQVSFTDYNRVKASDLVNAIASLYLDYLKEEKSRANKKKIQWLNGELMQIEKQLEAFEDYFEDFTIKNKTIDLNEDLSQTIKLIHEIDSQRYDLTQRIEASKQLISKVANEQSTFSVPDFLPRNEQGGIREKLEQVTKLFREKENLLLSYNENTFAVKKKEKEIASVRSTVEKQLNEILELNQQDLRELEKRKVLLEKNFVELPGKGTEYNKTQRFYALYEQFYLSLMQSKAEFEIADAGTITDFKILSAATLPTEPISPNKTIVHGIGVVMGIIFSMFFVAIMYVANNKIASIDEIEKISKAAILGIIPRYNEKIETGLLVDKSPKSAISESLRTIRTNIEFMFGGKKEKIISITSTVGGEGKTFVSVNLGGIIALSKRKVILVDLDMRKPKLHTAVRGENIGMGVSTILIDKHTIKESIRHTDLDTLDYIPAGPTPPNPSELILSNRFNTLLEELKKEYDVIILDTPPVGIVTDASLAMKKSDLQIYVFRADYSKKSFVKTLNRLINLNKFNNIAVILNSFASSRDHRYGYGYYEEKDSKPQFQSIFHKLIGKK